MPGTLPVIFNPTQVSAGGIKNLATDIANKGRQSQDQDLFNTTSRALQSLQNQINHLWQSIRNFTSATEAFGPIATSNVYDVNLVAGANVVSYGLPSNVGDGLVVFLIGPNAASTITWSGNFNSDTPTQFDPNGTTRYSFVGRVSPSTSDLQWSCVAVL